MRKYDRQTDEISDRTPDEDDMPEILPPSDDRVFKLLLTHSDAGPVLKDVVSVILGRKVREVIVRNNELPAGDIHGKLERLDVNCVTDDGEQIDLEMQASRIDEASDGNHANLKSKSLFYLCDLHSSQAAKGKSYSELAHTWQVTFCAYTIFPGDDRFFRTGRMRDEAGNVLTDDITMAFVELAKAARLAKKPVGELSPLEMWSIFFGYANRPRYRKVIREIFERRKEVDMAGTLLKSISKDEQERAIFRSRRMAQTDRESDRVTAEKRGEKRGVELERKRGEKQRDAERRKTVRVLKSEGVPVDLISKATGMTPEEITKTGRR